MKNTQEIEAIYNQEIKSSFLNKKVIFDIYAPLKPNVKDVPILLINDGQDLEQLGILKVMQSQIKESQKHFICVGIHTNHHRLQDYGTSYYPDYKGRGAKATKYMEFILEELLPNISNLYPNIGEKYFAGFSLGGLSAIDICLENPQVFKKAGVFSGSFWWRHKATETVKDLDSLRILHMKVRDKFIKEDMKFWFQCGTLDETADRNNNGIIDAIDDTLDLISALKGIGYLDSDIKYEEIIGGEHNFNTWKKVFPEFLTWLFNDQ